MLPDIKIDFYCPASGRNTSLRLSAGDLSQFSPTFVSDISKYRKLSLKFRLRYVDRARAAKRPTSVMDVKFYLTLLAAVLIWSSWYILFQQVFISFPGYEEREVLATIPAGFLLLRQSTCDWNLKWLQEWQTKLKTDCNAMQVKVVMPSCQESPFTGVICIHQIIWGLPRLHHFRAVDLGRWQDVVYMIINWSWHSFKASSSNREVVVEIYNMLMETNYRNMPRGSQASFIHSFTSR